MPDKTPLRDFLHKPAYELDELVKLTPLGKTSIYEEINANRLKRTKRGRRTIFLADDVADWLEKMREAA